MACSILAGEWFDDHMPDIDRKDASMHLRGKWLIEWAEMRVYSRSEADATKAFLTRQVERYRPSYGRAEVVEERQCIFIGSTNKAQYLTDETGGRRFWPVPCTDIDLDRIKADRDQLFAEAVQLFNAGVPWWPDREFEDCNIKPEQEARYETDEWQEPIAAYLATTSQTTVMAVAKGALGYDDKLDRFGTREQRRISSVMTVLGWKRAPRTGSVRPWVRG
jgi:predicted P-loop ATPase